MYATALRAARDARRNAQQNQWWLRAILSRTKRRTGVDNDTGN
jgi:hypothetical protein